MDQAQKCGGGAGARRHPTQRSDVIQAREERTARAESDEGAWPADFAALVQAHGARLVRSLTLITLDARLAEDAAQEAFLQLHLHWRDPAVRDRVAFQSIDERLRGVYERSAPAVNEDALRARLLSRTKDVKPAQPRRASRTRRSLGFAAATAIVLVAVGFGLNALVGQLTENKGMVVITDDPMSPTETGQPAGVVDGVYYLRYGQMANIDGLDISVTIKPIPVPSSESDPYPIISFHGEPHDWQPLSRLRSQYIITNTGSKTQMVNLQRFVALGEDGNHYDLMAQPLQIEPGQTLPGRLDFFFDPDVAANTVAYMTDDGTDDLAVWGPEAITEGPGYPVLTSLPPLRAKDVESCDYEGWDEQGRPLPVTVTAAENSAGVAVLIEYYGQTKLDLAQGYPLHTTPVHLTLHLKDDTQFSIWIGAPGTEVCIIQDTRAATEGNPPAAIGTNPALVRAFYGVDGARVETGWTIVNPPESGSETTTLYQAP